MSAIGDPAAPQAAAPNDPNATGTAPVMPQAVTGDPPPAAPSPAPVNPNQALLDRIDRLTAEKHGLARELESVRRGQAPNPGPGASPPAQPAAPTPAPAVAPAAPLLDAAEFERRVQEAAQARRAQETFAQTVSAIANEGLRAHPADWALSVQNLERINALDAESLGAIHALGNGHEIIYALSKDLNEAARIAALPAAQRGIAYARVAEQVKASAANAVSSAPPPAGAEVLGGAPAGAGPSDRDSMEEWARKRREARKRA